MKALTCEMCGGTNIVKQNGVYVCQSCGTKYSEEDRNKMMVEVTGTVTLDTSAELNNLYELARRAKESDNCENAAKYYDQILLKDPNNWEPYFYSFYFKAMNCNIDDIAKAIKNLSNCFNSVFSLIQKTITAPSEQYQIVDEIVDKTVALGTKLLKLLIQNFDFENTQAMEKEAVGNNDHYVMLTQMGYNLGDQIQQLFDNKTYKDLIVKAWNYGIYGYTESAFVYAYTATGTIWNPSQVLKTQQELVKSYESKIKELSPETSVNIKPTVRRSGCVVLLAIISLPIISLGYYFIQILSSI